MKVKTIFTSLTKFNTIAENKLKRENVRFMKGNEEMEKDECVMRVPSALSDFGAIVEIGRKLAGKF